MPDNKMELAIAKARTRWLRQFLTRQLPLLSSSSINYDEWFSLLLSTMEERGLTTSLQQKDYLTDVRMAISLLDPNHPALDVIKFDKETWTKINHHNSDRIARRTTKLISNPDAIVERATSLLKSFQWSEIAAGLAVVTGRRCTEILKTAQFEKKSKYSVEFRGSLKRKNEPVECVFEIPTLCQADLVKSAIASIRQQLGGELQHLSPKQVASRFSQSVATKCDFYFKDLIPPREDKDNLYTHLFRAIYATIASYWYCPTVVPEMEFRASIQGHYQILDEQNTQLRRSLAAGRHYFDYKISDGQGNIDGRLGIKLSLPDVRVIEKFQKYLSSHLLNSTKSSLPIPLPKDTSNHLLSSSQPITMNNSVGIPSFLLSDLQALSNELGLSESETIGVLFTWTKVGLSLARQLELDSTNPEALFDAVRSLKQRSSPSPDSSSITTDDEQKLLDISLSLARSVESLTSRFDSSPTTTRHSSPNKPRPTSSNTSSNTSSHHSPSSDSSTSTISPDLPQDEKSNHSSSNSSNEFPKTSNNSKTTHSGSHTVRRDNPDTVREDINHAIDAILNFNDAPNRPHSQKFYIGIGSVRDLCGRGNRAVREILDERAEEINAHLQQHQLDTFHNLRRKDDNGNEYPTIDNEPDISYHKITLVTDE